MKKLPGFIILIVFVFSSCTTYTPSTKNHTYPHEGQFNNAALAVKDYDPVGIIVVKSTETVDGDGNHTGSKITSEMLMLEAKKLDANDVINVKIDINQVEEIVSGKDGDITKTTYNYTATALAIKYTKAITSENISNSSIDIGKTMVITKQEVKTGTNSAGKNSGGSKALGIILAVLVGIGMTIAAGSALSVSR